MPSLSAVEPQLDVDVTGQAIVLDVERRGGDVELDVADRPGLAEQLDGVDPQRSQWVGHGRDADQWS